MKTGVAAASAASFKVPSTKAAARQTIPDQNPVTGHPNASEPAGLAHSCSGLQPEVKGQGQPHYRKRGADRPLRSEGHAASACRRRTTRAAEEEELFGL